MLKDPLDRKVPKNIAVTKRMLRAMRHYDELVNWSAVCQKAIQREINRLDKER